MKMQILLLILRLFLFLFAGYSISGNSLEEDGFFSERGEKYYEVIKDLAGLIKEIPEFLDGRPKNYVLSNTNDDSIVMGFPNNIAGKSLTKKYSDKNSDINTEKNGDNNTEKSADKNNTKKDPEIGSKVYLKGSFEELLTFKNDAEAENPDVLCVFNSEDYGRVIAVLTGRDEFCSSAYYYYYYNDNVSISGTYADKSSDYGLPVIYVDDIAIGIDYMPIKTTLRRPAWQKSDTLSIVLREICYDEPVNWEKRSEPSPYGTFYYPYGKDNARYGIIQVSYFENFFKKASSVDYDILVKAAADNDELNITSKSHTTVDGYNGIEAYYYIYKQNITFKVKVIYFATDRHIYSFLFGEPLGISDNMENYSKELVKSISIYEEK